MSNAGCIILAAGTARRMGRLKQLLPYRNSTLLEHAIAQAQAAALSPIVVVLGAEAARIRGSINLPGIHFVENGQWELGMGSSITCGLHGLLAVEPQPAAVAITLADQPRVSSMHLQAMVAELSGTEADTVAATFNGTLGSPAIFRATSIPLLLALGPEAGAKRLFAHPNLRVHAFPLPEAAADIDTPDDFTRLITQSTD